MNPVNEYGQPLGVPVDEPSPDPIAPVTLTGRTCRLEPLVEGHLAGLYASLCLGSPPALWTYMSHGPFTDRAGLEAYLDGLLGTPASTPLVVVLPERGAAGIACYLRTDAANGVTEVGSITLAAELQQTTASTEAMHLMLTHAFDDLGYRRLEWKCDSLNQPSLRAARRLGFTFEGVFRQAVVYKGRNRDTSWFSIIDAEWPTVRAAHQRWLDPGNFDEHGRQRRSLEAAPRMSAAAP